MRTVAFIHELRRVAGSILRSTFAVTSRLTMPWRRRVNPETHGTPEGLRQALEQMRVESRHLLAEQAMRLHGALGGSDARIAIRGRIGRAGSARALATIDPDLSDDGTVRDDRFYVCTVDQD